MVALFLTSFNAPFRVSGALANVELQRVVLTRRYADVISLLTLDSVFRDLVKHPVRAVASELSFSVKETHCGRLQF